MTPEIKAILENFRTDFAPWSIDLPPADVAARRAGFIQAKGWLIQYTFGRTRPGEYLDYYAAHRMTDDRHVRLYANGRRRELAALNSMHLTSAHAAEAARLEAAYFRRNQRVARALAAKGFDKFTLNMMLHTVPVDASKPRR